MIALYSSRENVAPGASPWSGYYFTLSAFQELRRSLSRLALHLCLTCFDAVEIIPGASRLPPTDPESHCTPALSHCLSVLEHEPFPAQHLGATASLPSSGRFLLSSYPLGPSWSGIFPDHLSFWRPLLSPMHSTGPFIQGTYCSICSLTGSSSGIIHSQKSTSETG